MLCEVTTGALTRICKWVGPNPPPPMPCEAACPAPYAGQYQITCQYCHYSVAYDAEPGIPSMGTCMGCHLIVGGSDSANDLQMQLVRKAWADKKPIEWVRVHSLARHVHFPHSQHIKAMGPNACATCHGDVTRMPQVYKVNNVNNMGWCINCHLDRGVNRDCTACHY